VVRGKCFVKRGRDGCGASDGYDLSSLGEQMSFV
jgi:hypothetical protein